MVTYKPVTVPLEDLLLDPNNFRFKHPAAGTEITESRFAEPTVQDAALERVRTDGIEELKNSIRENGFVPVERIVVRVFDHLSEDQEDDHGQKYVVVEGNRRTSALKILRREHSAGINLPESVIEVFSTVPVLVAQGASEDDLLAIMGIRHVGGPKEWGGYQSALLIYQLVEDAKQNPREVAHRLGLSTQEVNRRHKAFSALVQMKNDDEFGDLVTPDLYPIFHEAVGAPVTRNWLGWDANERKFTNDDTREIFFGWLTGTDDQPKKIKSYEDVRDLKQILENPDALTALKDDNQDFVDALAIVKSEAKATRWLPNAKAALTSLNEMNAESMLGLDETSLDVLRHLKLQATFIIRAYEVSQQEDVDEENI